MQRKTTEDKARIMVNKVIVERKVGELAEQIKLYDKNLYKHCLNVAFITAQIVTKLRLTKETQYDLVIAALLHDVGKINIPIDVINKKGSLTSEEFALIRTHVEEGVKILEEAGFKESIIRYVARHHECTDGSGYPKGLKLENMTEEDMIIAAVDKYDALTSKRIYGEEYSAEQAINILLNEGTTNTQCLCFINNCMAI